MKKRLIATGLSAVMLLSGALLSTASAELIDGETGEESAKTTISMVYKARKGKFVGSVLSPRPRCLGDRTVRLFKARNDARVDGAAHTNDLGQWSFAVKKNTGKYYAKVSAQSIVLDSGTDEYGELWEHLLNCGGNSSDPETTNS